MKSKLLFILVLSILTLKAAAQTPQEISINDLPKAAKDYVATAVPEAKIIRAASGSQNGVFYYAAVAEGRGRKFTFIFDKNGKFLQKVDDLSKINLQSSTLGGGTASTPATGNAQPENYRDLPLQSCPVKVQQYIKDRHPKGKVIKSGQYTKKGQGFFLVVVNDNNLDYNLHFSSKGDYMAKSSKITPAMPSKGTTPSTTTDPPATSKRRAPGSSQDAEKK